MPDYHLPPHVFVSFLDESCVWLDTRVDRFRSTTRAECRGLNSLVEGWPPGANDELSAPERVVGAQEVAESLVRMGLLVPIVRQGKTAASATYDRPTKSVPPGAVRVYGDTWRHFRKFLAACFRTFVTYNLGSLRHALAVVAKRKAAQSSTEAHNSFEYVRELVQVFVSFRLRVYTAKHKCLEDSFRLAHFLLTYGVSPTLIIGVTEGPFRAHCWLQINDTVLNDEFEHVGEFVPVAII